MIRDPIVEEIHQVREKLLTDCNDNLDQLLDRYKSSEAQDHTRVVSLQDVQRKSRSVGQNTTPTTSKSNQ